MIDFPAINAAALGNAEGFLQDWLPDGKRQGREWVARNPKRTDHRAGSFSVNLDSGIWKDFSAGDGGSDLISLWAYLEDCGQGDAARAIAADLRIENPLISRARRTLWQARKERATSKPAAPLTAISEGRPEPDLRHGKHGVPATAWEYENTAGRVVGYACRYETEKGKIVLPFSWTGSKWEWKAMPEPRPLYRLSRILKDPGAVVLVTEGEKAADAAQALFPEAAVTTWAGGCKAWRKTDWEPLKGRKVILWPDADRAGMATAFELHEHLLGIEAERVKVILLPAELPQGWDAADALADNWQQEEALQLLWGFHTTPDGLCPLCWREKIAAPRGGPTCKHVHFQWPKWTDEQIRADIDQHL